MLIWSLACSLALAAAPLADAPRPESPGPLLLVVDMAGNRLVVVDPRERAVRAEIPTGVGPHEVAASANGRLAFVSIYGGQGGPGHELSVIDVAACKEVRRVDLGAFRMPHGLAVVEGKVYFTAEANRALGRYDPGADAVDRVIGLGQDGTHMVAASPDGLTLYTTDIGSGTVSILSRTDGALAHVEVGGHPEGLAVSPDGREVWAGQRLGGNVTVIDAKSRTVAATIETDASMAARLRFTPDGRRVLLPDPQGGRLLLIDVRSRKVQGSIPVGKGPLGALVEPGTDRAYVPLVGEGKVAIVDLASRSVVGSIATGSISDGMTWVAPPAPAGPTPGS